MGELFGLPRRLEDGLILRWATPEDAAEIAAFNIAIHSDNPNEPDEFLGYWTHDLMNGRHPTTHAEDFTIVVDESNGNKIVSTLNLISQHWTYEGIEFGVGRPELVGTHPDYRQRGLIREQMEAVHAKSIARGELVQAITGIPWYYRMFGYEMALNLGGGREFFWARTGNYKPVDEEVYRLRKATPKDIPHLMKAYAAIIPYTLVQRVRNEALWAYEMNEAHPESPYSLSPYLIETAVGNIVAYTEYRQWGQSFVVREFAALPAIPTSILIINSSPVMVLKLTPNFFSILVDKASPRIVAAQYSVIDESRCHFPFDTWSR